MTTILQVDDEGVLHVPSELLPKASPRSQYQVTVEGGRIVLEPTSSDLLKTDASPQERAADFLRWAASHQDGPGLSDRAVSREGIYED